MGALPHPDLPSGPHHDLVEALHDLHHRAGWPSLRTLASGAGVSHTTVSKVFSSPTIPTWGTLELLVEAMDGDTSTFHDLWLAATSPPDATTPATPRIAGRTDELAAVRRHLETGSGLLLVTGEAGIGKTTLVTTAADATAVFVATGRCLPLSTAVPLLPVADGLQRVFDRDDGAWLKDALTSCAPYVAGSLQRLVPDVERLVDVVLPPRDEWSLQRLFSAVGAILASLGGIRPLGLVIEDLHWGDAATLDLIEHLTERGPTVPVVGTFRTDDPTTAASTSEWLGRVRRLPGTDALALPPLSREETAEQLSLVLGRRPAADQVTTIHDRSQGLPLFTEQLARAAGGEQPLPEVLADLFETRLAGLGAAARTVAHVLGVADRDLPESVVREAAGLSPNGLLDGLRELSRQLLLAPSEDRDLVRLRHPLLADAIRRRLVPGEATGLHRSVATALAAMPEPSPAEVALHWQRAAAPDREVTWRIAAARAAADRYASNEEADQWLRVIDLYSTGHVEPSGPALSEVYFAAIDAVWNVGRTGDSLLLVTQALERLEDLDGKPRADLYFRASARNAGSVSPSRSMVLVEQAIEMYRLLPPTTELALSLARRSSLSAAAGDWDAATRDMDEAAAVCEALRDIPTLRWVRAEQAWQEAMSGHRDQALQRIAAAAALESPAPDPRGDIRLGVFATDILLKCGGTVGEVMEAARQGLTAASEWDTSVFGSCLLRANVTEALILAGAVAAAAEVIDPAAADPVLAQQWPIQVEKAHLDAVCGRLDAAADRASSVVTAPNASLAYRLETLTVAAVVDLWRDEPRSALEAMLPLLDETASTGSSLFAGAHLVIAARAAADLADSVPRSRRTDLGRDLDARLRTLLDDMRSEPFGHRSVLADAMANEAMWRGEMSRLTGTQTTDSWLQAGREWERVSRPHDAAYCRWRAAQVALRDGQGTLAARLLRRATADAREHVPLSRAIAETAAGAR